MLYLSTVLVLTTATTICNTLYITQQYNIKNIMLHTRHIQKCYWYFIEHFRYG